MSKPSSLHITSLALCFLCSVDRAAAAVTATYYLQKPDCSFNSSHRKPQSAEFAAPTMRRNHSNMHAQGLFRSASFLKEQVTFISSDCHHIVSLLHSNSHQAKCARRVINTQYFNSEHSNDVTLSSSNIPVPPLLLNCENVCQIPCHAIYQPKLVQSLQIYVRRS